MSFGPESQQVIHKCFAQMTSALGERSEVTLPDGSEVMLNSGLFKNIVVIQPEGSRIDLSEMSNDLIVGERIIKKPAGHDSELDFIEIKKPFPETEQDIRVITGIASAIRTTK